MAFEGHGFTPDDWTRAQDRDPEACAERTAAFLERWLYWRDRWIYTQMTDILEIEDWANGEVR